MAEMDSSYLPGKVSSRCLTIVDLPEPLGAQRMIIIGMLFSLLLDVVCNLLFDIGVIIFCVKHGYAENS